MHAPVLSREEELHWLALKLVPGLGTRTSGKLLDRFRTPQAIFRASRTELDRKGEILGWHFVPVLPGDGSIISFGIFILND